MSRRNSIALKDLPEGFRRQLSDKYGITAPSGKGPRRNKYNVSPKEERTVDGIVFDSKWEARGYGLLKLLIGREQFIIQPRYILSEGFRCPVTGRKIRDEFYVGDFDVKDPDGNMHTLDFKGVETSMFRSKAKRFLKRYERPVIRIRTKSDLTSFLDEVGLLPRK